MSTIEIIDDVDKLARLSSDWQRLLESSEAPSVTQSPAWVLSWWEVFGPLDGRALRAGAFYSGGRLVGLAPLASRVQKNLGISHRRLELLPSGEGEEDEICSDYIGLFAERGFEAKVSHFFVEALDCGRFGKWDELVMPQMAGDTALVGALEAELAGRGYSVTRTQQTESPYIPLPDSWQAYLDQLSSSQRYRLRRAMRDFERWAKGSAELKAVTTTAELEAGLSTLEQLHAERWSAEGRAGVFASPRFRAFHATVAPKLFEAGALELLLLEAQGRPVAALYNLIYDGKVQFYQSGRAMDAPDKARVGVVAHALAIQRAIEHGRREYDFLPGPSQYKMGFALETRPVVSLRAARATLAERARRVANAGADRARAVRRLLC